LPPGPGPVILRVPLQVHCHVARRDRPLSDTLDQAKDWLLTRV